MFPHSVSTRRDPCVRIYAPLTLASPLTRKQNSNRVDPALFDPSEGAFELTYGSACIIGWWSGLLHSLISIYIVQFMGWVIGRIHHGLKVVFCLRHFTAFHNHHHTRLLMDIDHMLMFVGCLGEVWLTCCWSFRLPLIFITIYGVVCVQLAHFSIGDWKNLSTAHVIIIIKSEVSTFPIVITFFRGCVSEMFVTWYSVTYCIYIPGKPGICFHYHCGVYDECK